MAICTTLCIMQLQYSSSNKRYARRNSKWTLQSLQMYDSAVLTLQEAHLHGIFAAHSCPLTRGLPKGHRAASGRWLPNCPQSHLMPNGRALHAAMALARQVAWRPAAMRCR